MSALGVAGRSRAVFSRIRDAGDWLVRVIRGKKKMPEKRWSLPFVLNLISVTALVFYLAFGAFSSRFFVGINAQELQSVPGRLFILAKGGEVNIEDVVKGQGYWYPAEGLAPRLPDGVPVTKFAVGLPGDQIDVDSDGIRINGEKWGDLHSHVLSVLGISVADVTTSYVVGDDEVLLLGTLDRSVDGRYFGPHKITSVQGRWWRVF